jgi:serine/threonine protein kinase/tetratricopeptide (TPR) repeat protein
MVDTLPPGTRLGRYEIKSPIAAGGMGEVYLAEDTQLDRIVALKILPATVAADRQRMQRFIQEAKSASALNHPNILTIYEIGQQDHVNFIATEFIDGETIRRRIGSGQTKLSEVLDIASQVASALAKAHQSGIIHRDIKPENIMVNRDGYVKVLDFGLAKLAEQKVDTDPEAPTMAQINTEPGKVMGTTRYMSPEQARGQEIDARTDIWSLGVVLYELLTGHPPFEAATTSDLIVSILEREPPPLTRFTPDAPLQLERIIRKALAKDREDRYQVIKDLQIDLRNLKRELEVEAEIDRTVPSELRATTTNATQSGIETASRLSRGTAVSQPAGSTVSSAEYVVNEIKRHKIGFLIAAVILLGVIVLASFYARRAPALTDKDSILLADFVNNTGDQVFDGTLKQALAVQLTQSPYLSIVADDRVRETLRFMGKSPEERVTRDIGREICQRQGVKAVLAGTIANLGSNYVVTLEAVNAQSGDVIAREQAEAATKEQVLKALGTAASNIREKLGESLSSIQRFDAPVEQATTSSLEALKAFSLGDEMRTRGAYTEAIPFYKRAVEIDPNFALAIARLSVMYFNLRQFEPASSFSQRAFELRDRVSERERFYISTRYYQDVLGDIDRARESLQLWKSTYPRDYVPTNNLAVNYGITGEYEKQEQAARETLLLAPNNASVYSNLGFALLSQNRFDEGKAAFEQAHAKKLDTPIMHYGLYLIAVIKNDAAGMQSEVDWSKGKPFESTLLDTEAAAATVTGELKRARELGHQASEMALRQDQKELAARFLMNAAGDDVFFGNCGSLQKSATEARALSDARFNLGYTSVLLALCGDTKQSQAIADELAKKFPHDTYVNYVYAPMVQALAAMNRNDFAEALKSLELCRRFEMGPAVAMLPTYIRGLVYLRAAGWGKPNMTGSLGTEQTDYAARAAAEFKSILDHLGISTGTPFYPISHVGLARAAALKGDTAGARKSYQDFLALWKSADQDIPILREAKQEYEKLKE